MRVIAQNRYAAWRASIVIMGMLLLVGGQNALAVCIFNNQFTDASFALPATMTVSRTATVGTVLYRSLRLITQPQGLRGTCDANGDHTVAGYLAAVQAVAGMTGVYQTNIPGIGVRVLEVTNSSPESSGGPHRSNITLEANAWQHQWTHPPHGDPWAWNSFQVELIFTGPVSSGTLRLPSPLAGVYSSDSTTALVNQVLYARLLISGATQVITPGCTVDKNDIAVRLPTIFSNRLDSAGDTAGATPFNIALRCNSSTRVAYQIDGASPLAIAARTGILLNRTNTGDARGVGVQLLAGQGDSTTPVTLDNTLSDTFVTTTSDNQPVSIPFVARYIRTYDAVTPGAVWAQATFTMNYQ